MEDEIDIYADLPNFNLGDNENLVEKNKRISEKCTKLEKQVTDLTQSLESLQKINNNLEVNLSSLLQTAKAEIARKDRMIAEIRRELDNMQFRRGEYSKATKPRRRSPLRRNPEHNPEERNYVAEVPKVPDTTEFMCDNPPPSIKNDDDCINKPHQLNGIVKTVFGERLRKRILEEQEEERKQKEQSKAKAELDSKKITGSIKSDQISESDAQSSLKADSLKIDCKVNKQNKDSSLGSSSSFNSQKNDGFLRRNHSDRKRQSEDQAELANSKNKKSKSNDGKSRYRDNSDHRDGGTRSSFKNSSKSKSDERPSTEISVSNDLTNFQTVDEHEAPAENDRETKSESVNTADDNDNQGRHNRVAMRLMLLAEGIDPDVEAKKSAEDEQKKVVDDKKESSKKNVETSRSRSKSKNRRHNHRSRSRTPDEYWRNRRRSKERGDRYRKSKDRFERQRDSKNKDGDNLSEFSREICELKDRIEHRVDDRSSDRTGKGRSSNRYKRSDERSYKNGRSRTPDSSRSGSKERTVRRSRYNKQYGRSRSRERHRSRNRGKSYSNFDDTSTQNSKPVVLGTKKTENVETMPTKASPQIAQNPETKSLLSLEDGEILDSASSSPVKIVNSVESVTDKTLPSNCKLNLLDSDSSSKITEVKCSLPLREIGNRQNIEKPLLGEKPALSIPESNQSINLNDSLNSSKDERIENIAEFIAKFSTDVLESKQDEIWNDELIQNDASGVAELVEVAVEETTPKENILNTVFQGSLKDSPLASLSVENNNPVDTKNINGNNGDDNWCLIAIDSPIKNFEENRKNRIMAQNLQIAEELETSKSVSTNDLANTSSKLLCANESQGKKMDSEVEKVVPDKTAKSLVKPTKNTSKTKPAVLKSLRSTYHKGRKEIILSDTNSEQCTKISVPHSIDSAAESLSNESETVQQSRNNIDKPAVESENIRKLRSKSPVLEDVEHNCNNSENGYKKTVDDLLKVQNDSMNPVEDKKTTADDHPDMTNAKKVDPPTIVQSVDETTKKSGKSKANNSKTNKEMTTKIGGNPKPELRNSMVKESKSKQTTACKIDLSTNTNKADVTKSVGSRNKTGCKVESTDGNEESNVIKSLENGIKQAKAVSKAKDEGSNSKQKKEPRKLVVFARRRKPVHLEDSSTSSNIVTNQNSPSDTVDNDEKSINNDIQPLNSLDVNSGISTDNDENQARETIAEDGSANDHQSVASNVKEKHHHSLS